VTKKNVIYRGAEAEICLSKYMGYKVVEKRRVKKRYRIKNIDDRLISSRLSLVNRVFLCQLYLTLTLKKVLSQWSI